MNPEPVLQGQVSQKEKNKYHIVTHIYMESRKTILMNLFAGQQWIHRHRTDLWTWGRGRKERVSSTERVTWKHILPYGK